MRLVWLIAALAAATINGAAAGSAGPEIEWKPIAGPKDVVSIRGNAYDQESAGQPWSIQRAANTVGDVTRFELRYNDRWVEDTFPGENPERTQLDGYRQVTPEGSEAWAAFSFFVEPGPFFRSAWTVIGQIHNQKGSAIPLNIQFNSEFLRIHTSRQVDGAPAVAATHFSRKIARGEWHRVVLRFREGVAGELDFWLNGEQVVKYSGPIGSAGDTSYWKFGIYRGPGPISAPLAIQFANMEVGPASLAARIRNPLPIEFRPAAMAIRN
jgi:hypothetical protein